MRAEINFFFPSRVGFTQNVIPSHETGIKKTKKQNLTDGFCLPDPLTGESVLISDTGNMLFRNGLIGEPLLSLCPLVKEEKS